MFSLPYFNKSHIDLKATETFDRGSFIEWYYEYDDVKVALYSLDTFYVEMYMKDSNDKMIFDIVGISPGDAVDKYCL